MTKQDHGAVQKDAQTLRDQLKAVSQPARAWYAYPGQLPQHTAPALSHIASAIFHEAAVWRLPGTQCANAEVHSANCLRFRLRLPGLCRPPGVHAKQTPYSRPPFIMGLQPYSGLAVGL